MNMGFLGTLNFAVFCMVLCGWIVLTEGFILQRQEWNIPSSVLRATDTAHPNSLIVAIPTPSIGAAQSTVLILKKASAIVSPGYESFKTFFGVEEEIVTTENCTLYRDVNQNNARNARFTLCGFGLNVTLTGEFLTNGNHFHVHDTDRTGTHVIEEVTTLTLEGSNALRIASNMQNADVSSVGDDESDIKADFETHHEIKLALFMDDEAFQRFVDRTSPYLPEQSRLSKAKVKAQKYMIHMTELIGNWFNTLSDENEGVFISVKPVHVAVGKISPDAESHTYGNAHYVSSEKALTRFEEYVSRHENRKDWDHAILVTGRDIAEVDGYISDSLTGVTTPGSLCTDQTSVSVVEYTGAFLTATLGAHFLARSMGLPIDGVETSADLSDTCGAQLGYIMAPYVQQPDVPTSDNYHRFSPCSVKAIRKFLHDVQSSNRSCLTEGGDRWTVPSDPSLPKIDVEFNAHYLCMDLHGEGWLFSGGARGSIEICQALTCVNPATGETRVGHMGARGIEGTQCGPKGSCHIGQCSVDPTTPPIPCPHGDSRIVGETGHVECDRIEPQACYDSAVLEHCCLKCPALQRQDLPAGCEWGDRADHCRNKTTNDCSDSRVAEDCCELCSRPSGSQQDKQIEPVSASMALNSTCIDLDTAECLASEGGHLRCRDPHYRRICCQLCNVIEAAQHRMQALRDDEDEETTPAAHYDDCAGDIAGTSNCLQLIPYCKSDDVDAICCATCHPYHHEDDGTDTPAPVVIDSPSYVCRDILTRRQCLAFSATCWTKPISSLCCETCAGVLLPTVAPCTTNQRPDCANLAIFCETSYIFTRQCCVTCNVPTNPPCVDSFDQAMCMSYADLCSQPVVIEFCYCTCRRRQSQTTTPRLPAPAQTPSTPVPITTRSSTQPPASTQTVCTEDGNREQCSEWANLCSFSQEIRDFCCATCSSLEVVTGSAQGTARPAVTQRPPAVPPTTAAFTYCTGADLIPSCPTALLDLSVCSAPDGLENCCSTCNRLLTGTFCVNGAAEYEGCAEVISQFPASCSNFEVSSRCCVSCS